MTNPIPSRLAALRQAMQRHGVAACLVPTADPHLSEYLPAHWAAREWLSGFTGSAGALVVTADVADLWTDSRYFSQAEQQLADSGVALKKQKVSHAPEHLQWLQQHLHEGDVLAVAGDSLSVAARKQVERLLGEAGARVRTDLDLPGEVWIDRPALPKAVVFEHAPGYPGSTRAEKLERLRTSLRRQQATHHLVSSLDDVAWLTNLRGSDVECNPVFLAHLLVETDGPATLFVDRGKLSDPTVAALKADGIRIADYATLTDALGALGTDALMLLDPSRVACAVAAATGLGAARAAATYPSPAL